MNVKLHMYNQDAFTSSTCLGSVSAPPVSAPDGAAHVCHSCLVSLPYGCSNHEKSLAGGMQSKGKRRMKGRAQDLLTEGGRCCFHHGPKTHWEKSFTAPRPYLHIKKTASKVNE